MEPEQAPTTEKPSLATLSGGILHDVQLLIKQHIVLAKLEFFKGWENAKPLALWLAVALGAALAVAVLAALMTVHVINETTHLPLSACYGITALPFLLLGVVSAFIVRKRMKAMSFHNG